VTAKHAHTHTWWYNGTPLSGCDQGNILTKSQCFPSPLIASRFVISLRAAQEKKDKVVLMAEMADLRENNQRLQEESMSASEQLRKFSMLFTNPQPERK